MAKLVYRRKNGKWEARYRKGTSPDGKPLYGTVYGETEAEAIARRAELLGCDPLAADAPAEMNLLIIGAGVHGHDCREIAESLHIFRSVKFLDDTVTDNPDVIGRTRDIPRFRQKFPCAFVAIGDNGARRKFSETLRTMNYLLPSLVSPLANISPKARIGVGAVVFPGCSIHEADIGDFVIVDTNTVINSGTRLGDYTRIDCGGIVRKGASTVADTWIHSGEIYGKQEDDR